MSRKTFKKKITDDKIIEKINPINKKLVDKFLKNFNIKSSKTSVDNYKSDYNIFFCWNVLYNDNKSFIELKKSELIDFFNFTVIELQWGGSRYRRVHSALSSLSKFIENVLDEEYPNFRNLLPKIDKIPNEPKREKTVLTDMQVDNLLNHLITTNIQHACFLALAISSGARISELFRFTTDLIDGNNTGFDGVFLKTTKQIKTKGHGRDGVMMYKYIIKDIFMPIYKQWLPVRKEILEKNNILEDHKCIFIRRDGLPATVSIATRWMKKWEKYLTEEEPSNINHNVINLYPHSLRHYMVSHLTRLGLSSDLIVSIMGWKTSDMYHVYNDVLDDEREWEDLSKLKKYLDKKE